mmetsp:Transcript_42773/g.93031  ORF Transcript_42773/g.93031 Transcript_42773/m.93031 type:complete len:201 (-) Transcript_42773:646-1248(-)
MSKPFSTSPLSANSVSCMVPWKPEITARSPSAKFWSVCASRTGLFIVISLITASFCTTLASSCVSLPNFLASSTLSSERSSFASSFITTSMSVTDWKMVEAICRTWVKSCSKGFRTMLDTDCDRIKENAIIKIMTMSSKIIFIHASSWLGDMKLNSTIKWSLVKTTLLLIRVGGPFGEFQGNALVTSTGCCMLRARTLHG